MRLRVALTMVLGLFAVNASAEVQTFGEVSFDVPYGFQYRAEPGKDYAAMVLKAGNSFLVIAVYTPMPSSGNAKEDVRAAWRRIVLAGKDYQGMAPEPYYETHSVGYSGLWAGDSSTNRGTWTFLAALEAGRSFIPVVVVGPSRDVYNAAEQIVVTFIGSVRLAPFVARAVKTSITVGDLAGHWKHGAASSYDFFNRQTGRYESNASAFYGAGYTIAADGSFTYEMAGMVNGRTSRDNDTGVVELRGDIIIFKGRNHVVRYRFINCQEALDGSTVLTVLDENQEVTAGTILRYGDKYTREAPRK